MANIILTYKCNLKCPYCFANEFVNKINEEISFENFLKVLEFIKRTPKEKIGLIGGEPTLHKQFGDFLNVINKDKSINSVILYTNGIYADNYVNELKNKKFDILINCNSPANLGNSVYLKLKENISLFHKKKSSKNITLGINIYDKNADYSYIIDLLKENNQNKLRLSIVVPNEKHNLDPINSFKSYKNTLLDLIMKLEKQNIVPFYDCNTLPDCIWTEEEQKYLLSLKKISEKNKTPFNLLHDNGFCGPTIDILPSLNAIRCFGFSELEKINIFEYSNINDLRKYFIVNWDFYCRHILSSENCIDCAAPKTAQCSCGCMTYKIENVINLKKYANEINNEFLK